MHVLSWATLQLPASQVSGRTGTGSASPLLKLLEASFSASIDVRLATLSIAMLQDT